MSRHWWLAVWIVWLGVVLCATIVYHNVFVGHSHWFLVQWLPSKGPGTWLEYVLDVAANVLLFGPLGYAQAPAGLSPTRRGLLVMGVTSFVLSLGIELVQVYSHNRLASTSDIVANTLGGILGAYLRLRYPYW